MGIKLFVDDLRIAPDASWVVVRTVTEAIRFLATQDVELVALDHDICHTYPGDEAIVKPFPCPETFEPVARYIALMPKPPRVTIHTSNPAGQKKMEKILEKGEWDRELAAKDPE